MSPNPSESPAITSPSQAATQTLDEMRRIHRWYQTLMTFEPPIIQHCLERMDPIQRHRVVDPFCGTGTTLVECAKFGYTATGIDASPIAVLASRAKTTWHLRPTNITDKFSAVLDRIPKKPLAALANSRPYKHFKSSGMLERKWISATKLLDVLTLLDTIRKVPMSSDVRRLLKLSALSICVESVANVKFGPEIYHVRRNHQKSIEDLFERRMLLVVDDLTHFRRTWPGALGHEASVRQGDARTCSAISKTAKFGALITSPPYPNEHDYTRNTRIELVLGGFVGNGEELRTLKKRMLRSTTKGIYKTDADRAAVSRYRTINNLAKRLDQKAKHKEHGFARLYSTVVREYFGGMLKHLRSIASRMKSGAPLAYVVGEQRTYLQVRIPTADILAHLAQQSGFYKVRDIETWKKRKGSTGRHTIDEEILYLERR